MSPEDVNRARAWRAETPPVSWRECARRLNYCANTLKRALNPAVREKHLRVNRRWYDENIDSQHERDATRAKTPGRKASVSVKAKRRYAQEKAAPGDGYTPEQVTWLLENVYTDGHCCYCKRYGPGLEMDHVVAVSRGGSNHPENLVWCCPRCNASKGAKTLAEWRSGTHLDVIQLAIDAAALVRDVFENDSPG